MKKHLALALVCLAAPAALEAQILYGSIVGNVTDATDAAVPGATVVATHTQTNQSRQAVTNDAGSYSLPTLDPGVYTLKVSREGFNSVSESNVTVSINSVTRVDVSLKVGAVSETISVSGQAAALQTDRSEVRAEV